MFRARNIPRLLAALGALGFAVCLAARTAAADEFTLDDGRKIVGTIVGYEKDMFRVETDFGFILIRKDKVVSIRVVPGAEKKSGEVSGANQPAAGGSSRAATDTEPSSPAKSSPPSAVAARPAPPPPPSRPLNEPLPANLREHVEGNDYVNDTFQFAMFKPPQWKLFEEGEKVSAIVALSSPDEHTLLFVDRQVWSGRPDLSDDRVEANLRRTYQDYKKLAETTAEVDGLPALRREFTGVIDGVEWHGVSVRVARGNTVFGIVGLTSAETYRFYQAVINKIIKSFHFITPAPEQGAALRPNPGR